MTTLNLGCGKVKIDNWVNVDINGGDIKADALNLPFKDNSFDGVYTSHCLEHILNMRKVMKEINRVSKKDSPIFIRVPYGLKGLYEPYHFRAFDLHTFSKFTHIDLNSLEFEELFKILSQRISDYEIPIFIDYFMYNPKYSKFMRKCLRLLGLNMNRFPDGRIVNPYPLTQRKEITCILKTIK